MLDRAAAYAVPYTLDADFGHSNLEYRTYLVPVQCSNDTPTTSPCEERKIADWEKETLEGQELPLGNT
jgi:hypothetical protein